MVRQARDGTTCRPCVADLDMVKAYAVDGAHMIDGNQFGDGVFVAVAAQSRALASHLIATTAVTQADEDG